MMIKYGCGEFHKDQREQNFDFPSLLLRSLLLSLHFNRIYRLFFQAAVAAAAHPDCHHWDGKSLHGNLSPFPISAQTHFQSRPIRDEKEHPHLIQRLVSLFSPPATLPGPFLTFFLLSSQTLLIPLKNLTNCNPSAHGRNIFCHVRSGSHQTLSCLFVLQILG